MKINVDEWVAIAGIVCLLIWGIAEAIYAAAHP